MAPVCIGDKWGYIDKKGKLKIPAIYDGANPFSEGLALVCDTDDNGTGITYYVINTKGKIQFSIADHYFPSKIPYFHNGVILMVNRHCPYDPYFYRYYDRKGNCIYEWKDGYQYEWETEEHKPYAAPAEVISIEQKYQRIINQNYQLGK